MELLCFWFVRSRFYPNKTLISVIRSVFLCLYTERCWNMWIPGFGSDELRPFPFRVCDDYYQVDTSHDSAGVGEIMTSLII